MITAAESMNNVRKYRKDFGTPVLEKLSYYIEQSSLRGETSIEVGPLSQIDGYSAINKKDYYMLKRNGFNITFSATYEKERVSQYMSKIKTREISLTEYFGNSPELEDKVAIISWEAVQ